MDLNIVLLILSIILFTHVIVGGRTNIDRRIYVSFGFVILAVMFAVLVKLIGFPTFAINFLLLLFISWALLFVLCINRKLIYTASLILLLLAAAFSLINFKIIGEQFAICSFLLLLAGVLKDLFTDHIYEN